jgi:hypothetical protein
MNRKNAAHLAAAGDLLLPVFGPLIRRFLRDGAAFVTSPDFAILLVIFFSFPAGRAD